MRLADRVLAERVKIPTTFFAVNNTADTIGSIDAFNDGVRVLLKDRPPIIEASVVADQVFASPIMKIEDFPCLAPPWTCFWLEYHRPRFAPKEIPERWGVLVTETDIAAFAKAAATRNWPVDAERSFAATLYIEDRGAVHGPCGMWEVAIDGRGLGLQLDWSISSNFFRERPGGLKGEAATNPHFQRMVWTTMQTITFLHCRNVHLVKGDSPPRKVAEKQEKKLGRPLVEYSVVAIDPFRSRRVRSGATSGEGDPVKKRLHPVIGHFAHFGDCCPGVHEPNGLAFGKLTGMFWSPQHVRGDLEAGALLHDYEVKPRGRVPARP